MRTVKPKIYYIVAKIKIPTMSNYITFDYKGLATFQTDNGIQTVSIPQLVGIPVKDGHYIQIQSFTAHYEHLLAPREEKTLYLLTDGRSKEPLTSTGIYAKMEREGYITKKYPTHAIDFPSDAVYRYMTIPDEQGTLLLAYKFNSSETYTFEEYEKEEPKDYALFIKKLNNLALSMGMNLYRIESEEMTVNQGYYEPPSVDVYYVVYMTMTGGNEGLIPEEMFKGQYKQFKEKLDVFFKDWG